MLIYLLYAYFTTKSKQLESNSLGRIKIRDQALIGFMKLQRMLSHRHLIACSAFTMLSTSS